MQKATTNRLKKDFTRHTITIKKDDLYFLQALAFNKKVFLYNVFDEMIKDTKKKMGQEKTQTIIKDFTDHKRELELYKRI